MSKQCLRWNEMKPHRSRMKCMLQKLLNLVLASGPIGIKKNIIATQLSAASLFFSIICSGKACYSEPSFLHCRSWWLPGWPFILMLSSLPSSPKRVNVGIPNILFFFSRPQQMLHWRDVKEKNCYENDVQIYVHNCCKNAVCCGDRYVRISFVRRI